MKYCRWLCLALAAALLCVPALAAGAAEPEKRYAQAVEDARTIEPEELLRPAFDPDVTTNTMTEELTGENWYRSWFADNAAASYGEDGYPWIRLGYTYD